MIEEASDFSDESIALYGVVANLGKADYDRRTQFKGWSINDILQHLHFFNIVADLSLTNEAAFADFYGQMLAKRENRSLVDVTDEMLDGLCGPALLDAWRGFAEETACRFRAADAKRRVKWVGPDMSARTSISARLMETWAHGQEIYDLLGVKRRNTDRIKSIAVIGANTQGWTFRNRGETPEPKPYLRLTAPSGAVWTWNEPSEVDYIEGEAEEFCQVVTQVRNVSDTWLHVVGKPAARWMAVAQCFAGPPRTPPAPGTRGPDAPNWA